MRLKNTSLLLMFLIISFVPALCQENPFNLKGVITGTANQLVSKAYQANSLTFNRTVLVNGLSRPWELLYGPDNMLWITQKEGKVCRVDPSSGVVTTIYTAPDYFAGDPSQGELLPCNPTNMFGVSAGTYGMALHPDFLVNSYIYFIYSCNAATPGQFLSKFKVRRLTWNPVTQSVTTATDIISDLPLDRSHEGMRMLIITQAGVPYIYITAGDGTIDDDGCYAAGNNANLRAQDWNSKFGKILRYNIDGTIPSTNPISGNPVFTSGHRNPLGLAYNPSTDKLYSSENGKSTDDEINYIEKGKNYGWPKARGYHTDNNYPGEAAFVAGYVPSFPGNELREALYSWCPATVTLPEDPQNVTNTCVVAPSDIMYYPAGGLPEFNNSLLVTTLKNFNPDFRACVYVFKLNANGTGLDTSSPNPKVYFRELDPPTLRYRDITTTPDGKTFFICTDSWDGVDNKILKFTYVPPVVYTFTGSGNWNVAANWSNNFIPPSSLPAGSEIIINPSSGDCILNVPLVIPAGVKLTVNPGKNFVIQGNLIMQ